MCKNWVTFQLKKKLLQLANVILIYNKNWVSLIWLLSFLLLNVCILDTLASLVHNVQMCTYVRMEKAIPALPRPYIFWNWSAGSMDAIAMKNDKISKCFFTGKHIFFQEFIVRQFFCFNFDVYHYTYTHRAPVWSVRFEWHFETLKTLKIPLTISVKGLSKLTNLNICFH